MKVEIRDENTITLNPESDADNALIRRWQEMQIRVGGYGSEHNYTRQGWQQKIEQITMLFAPRDE